MLRKVVKSFFAVAVGAVGAVLAAPAPVQAQGWPDWASGALNSPTEASRRVVRQGRRGAAAPQQSVAPFFSSNDDDDDDKPQNAKLLTGGPRPDIDPEAPPVIAFRAPYKSNSIVIDSKARRLYYVLPGGQAYVYRISVGREGFAWTGVEKISRKQAWPDWHPPAEMKERDPRLPDKMTGGIRNPLGAVALYLGSTLYRIHGTNDPKSIGRAASSGCFRMMNDEVMHLASIAKIGTTVTVVNGLGNRVAGGAKLSQSTVKAPNRAVSTQ